MRRALLSVAALAIGAYAIGLRANTDTCMPEGLWIVRPLHGPLERGDVVVACPSANRALEQGARLGFLKPAPFACPTGWAPLLKIVAAVPGDVVLVDSDGISVNGGRLDQSAALPTGGEGQALLHVEPGRYIVPPGEVWLVIAGSAEAFDSRYFGPVRTADLTGRASPVLTR